MAMVFIMALSKGIRNILSHQIEDYDNDRNNKLITFAVNRGVHKTQSLINNFLIPLETASLAIAAYYILNIAHINTYVLVVFVVLPVFYAVFKISTSNLYGFVHRFLNDIYEDILPLFFLVSLCFIDLRYLALLAVHVVVFKNKLIYWLFGVLIAVFYSFLFRKVIIWLYYKMIWLGLNILVALKWMYHSALSLFIWLAYKVKWLYDYPIKWFYYKPLKWFYYKAFCNRCIKSVLGFSKKKHC